jgi:hypothetical protein
MFSVSNAKITLRNIRFNLSAHSWPPTFPLHHRNRDSKKMISISVIASNDFFPALEFGKNKLFTKMFHETSYVGIGLLVLRNTKAPLV